MRGVAWARGEVVKESDVEGRGLLGDVEGRGLSGEGTQAQALRLGRVWSDVAPWVLLGSEEGIGLTAGA